MNTKIHALGACALALNAPAALAAPVDMIIDQAQSSIDLTMTVDVSIASDTDSDSSPLSGSLVVEFDDNGMPSQISLIDLMVVIDNTLNFNWSFGFFGSADAVMTNGSVSYAAPGVTTGPVALIDDAFAFPAVPVELDGQLNVDYDIFLVGSDSVSIGLADQGAFDSIIAGDISIVDDTVTISTTLPLDAEQPIEDADGNVLGTVFVTGSATIVACGSLPSCPADINGDGMLNFFDVSGFLSLFGAMDAQSDFNEDGMFNFFDVSAFLASYSAGCP
jgi:hypothetical protein